MVLTASCVSNRKGWVEKRRMRGSRGIGEVPIGGDSGTSTIPVNMYVKTLLLTMLLGILVYTCAVSASRSHPKHMKSCSQRADDTTIDDWEEPPLGGSSGASLSPVVCQKRQFFVNLTLLLGKVTKPDRPVNIGVCEGTCSPTAMDVLGKLILPPYPNTFRSLAVLQASTQGYGCCVPDKYTTLRLLVQEEDGVSCSRRTFSNVVVESCGCLLWLICWLYS